MSEDALRDAWLAECWEPVREYSNAEGRVPPKPQRKVCPYCYIAYSASNLARHRRTRHPGRL